MPAGQGQVSFIPSGGAFGYAATTDPEADQTTHALIGGGGGVHRTPASTDSVDLTPPGTTTVQEIRNLNDPRRVFYVENEGAVSAANTDEHFGATAATTDSSTAFQAAINKAQAAGGGVVDIGIGSWRLIAAGMSITMPGVTIRGQGQYATNIYVNHNASITPISAVAPTTNPWGGNWIGGPARGLVIRDLRIKMDFNSTPGTIAIAGQGPNNNTPGISISGFLFPKLINVSVEDFGTNIAVTGSTQVQFSHVIVLCTNATVTTAYGIKLDSTAQNPSVYADHCAVNLGGFSGTNSYGWYTSGPYISDLFLSFCESDGLLYGFFIDGSTSTADAYRAIDIHLLGCVADQSKFGLYLNGLAAGAVVDIDGGYHAYSGGGGRGVVVNNSQGVIIRGFQAIGASGTSTGVEFTGTSGGCSLTNSKFQNGLTTGVSVGASCFNILISHNIFQSTVTTPIVVTAGAVGVISKENVGVTNVVTTPAVTSGVALTPSTVADTTLYLTYALAGSITSVTMGPSTGAENTVYGATVVAVGGLSHSLSVPTGWKVVVTTVTSTITATVVTK